jgi:hypothetical protein
MLPSTGNPTLVHGDVGIQEMAKQAKGTGIQNRARSASRLALERWNIEAPHARTYAASRLLADIRELASGITSRAAEIEAGRRIPPDLVDTLKSIGVFRMLVPESHG